MRRIRTEPRFWIVLLGGIGLISLGCEVDVHDGIGPREPNPNVTGRVLRDGDPAEGLEVDLRTAPDAINVADGVTDDEGRFAFADVAPGRWEIKVSGDESEDFDSVSQEFTLDDLAAKTILPALDVSAHGARLLAPEEDAALAIPTIFLPVVFSWTPPERDVIWSRVQVYDEADEAVWFSTKEAANEVMWIGRGSEGSYEGLAIAAGRYSWRVKIAFSDSSEARFDRWEITFE